MSEPIQIAAEILGDGPPLVVLHGLFGSGRNWGGVARRLAESRQVHLLDARNHGASPWSPAMNYPAMAEDLAAYIEGRSLAPADLLGHSMGGKTAMLLALTRPALVRQLVVVDIAPVNYRGGAQQAYGGYIAAMRALDVAHLRRRAEADAALAAAIPDAQMRAFLVQNLETHGDGYRWRVNLDAIIANLDQLTDFPDVDARYPGPTTVIAGELSNYVRPRDEVAIRQRFPAARIVVLDGAGHWVHADQPERLLGEIRKALAD